jgi:hypothetical protein
MPTACDGLLPHGGVRLHRAVWVDAPPAMVFRWLCQLKPAPYNHDLLDNRGRRSPRELTGGAEDLEVGQRFMSIFSLASLARDEHLTLRGRRVAVTYAVRPHRGLTRLLARGLFNPSGGRVPAALAAHLLALGDRLRTRRSHPLKGGRSLQLATQTRLCPLRWAVGGSTVRRFPA